MNLHNIGAEISRELADNHIATYCYGSRARGDHRPDSDLDLAVVCKAADLETLRKVGAACRRLNLAVEANPWIIGALELEQLPRASGLAKLHMEGKLLAGRPGLPAVCPDDLTACSVTLLSEAAMSLRHYIVSGEADTLPQTKYERYVCKPFRHGIRYQRYLTGNICLTNDTIEGQYPSLRSRDYERIIEDCFVNMHSLRRPAAPSA